MESCIGLTSPSSVRPTLACLHSNSLKCTLVLGGGGGGDCQTVRDGDRDAVAGEEEQLFRSSLPLQIRPAKENLKNPDLTTRKDT